MPGKMARSTALPPFGVTRATAIVGAAAVLPERGKSAKIYAGSWFIWRIPVKTLAAIFSTILLTTLSVAPSAAQQYKYETPMPTGVATPDTIETSIGTMHLSY